VANEWLRKPPPPRRRQVARPRRGKKALITPPVQPVSMIAWKRPLRRPLKVARNNAAYFTPRRRGVNSSGLFAGVGPQGTVRGYVVF
jgi:hypothetical protein